MGVKWYSSGWIGVHRSQCCPRVKRVVLDIGTLVDGAAIGAGLGDCGFF